jgi:protocatechuate 3,4-dioxygenase beta subunit
MSRPHPRWLTLAAVTLVVAAALPASAALAETTTGTISGHLLDGTAPVPNVTVDVINPDVGFAGEGTTDASGAFTINDIAPASYVVQFSLPGGLTQYSHGKLAFNQADLITVTSGATTSVEETVVPHGSLGGTLTDNTGAPVANWFVSVASTSSQVFLNTRTDATGHYLVPIVPAGSYTVSFGPSFPDSGIGQTAHNKPGGSPGDVFTVVVGATTTVDEQLVNPGVFTGRVTTADGLGASGVEVTAFNQFGAQFTITDASGQYRIPVFPGTYKLSFERSPGSLTQWAHGQKNQSSAASFTVGSGDTTVVDEQLLPTGTLAGRLLDANGQPVSFASVFIFDTKGNQAGFANVSNGNWQTPVYPGTYKVEFGLFFPVTGSQWATGKTTQASADTFTVQVGQTTRVDDALLPAGTVTLTVLDSTTGAPVSYCASIGASFACSDSNGTATSQPLLPGPVQVFVGPNDNHLPLQATVTVVSGQNTTLALTADPAASITTTVRDSASGAPLRNICVSAISAGAPSGASGGPGGCTNSDGQITMSGLRAGSYNVFAFSNDGVHGHQWVGPTGGTGLKQNARVTTLTSGQAATIPDIKMDKAGILTGVIRDKATGAPIPGAVASWGTSPAGRGGSQADVVADTNGRYTFNNLGPYDWPIFYHAFGYAGEWSGNTGNRLESNPIGIKAGKTSTHNVVLGQGVTLSGVITDAAGQPLDEFGARITVYNADSGDEIGSNDNAADGTYTELIVPKQTVVLGIEEFAGGHSVTFFYVNAPDMASATRIPIKMPGPIAINISTPPQG